MKTALSLFVTVVCAFLIIPSAWAEVLSVGAGETVTIGEFVYDDDYVATTTPCTMTIYDPANTLKINGASMTANANGWHYYDYSVPLNAIEGPWPTSMICGSALGGDLIKADKTFVVDNSIQEIENNIASTTDDVSDIASELGTGNISAIKTKTDSITWSDITSIPTNVATAVWSAGTRSLTTFGSLVADVWSAGTRTLTGAGLSSGSLATQADVTSASSSVSANILAVRAKTQLTGRT